MQEIGFVVAAVAGLIAGAIWFRWASLNKAIKAEKSELEASLRQLEARSRKTEHQLAELTRHSEKLRADLELARERRDEKAIASAIWALELDRTERQWRDVVVPDSAMDQHASASVGRRLAFAVECEVDRMREEVGVSIRFSGQLDLDMEPETALGALRIAEELLAVCAKRADEIDVRMNHDNQGSAVLEVACQGWEGRDSDAEGDSKSLEGSELGRNVTAMVTRLNGWTRFSRPGPGRLEVSVKLPTGTTPAMTTIDLKSSAFSDHAPIPARFAKDNDNVSPELVWDEAPEGTAELVITCEDPDAPGGTFIHWLVAGIDPINRRSDEGKSPIGAVEGINGYGDIGFGGPQPPVGDDRHRYFFRIHACSRPLALSQGFTIEQLRRELAECEIGTGTTVGTYQR